MSYHFKSSGYPGEDYLIVTKKGKEEGKLPNGIILLGGLMYCNMDFRRKYITTVCVHFRMERSITATCRQHRTSVPGFS